MNLIFEVSYTDIEKLNDSSLSDLMSRLLYLEVGSNNLWKSGVSGSLNITIGDGGQDGGVSWDGHIEKTDWFPTRNCLFQCKAMNFEPQECYNELFRDKKNKTLKPMLEDIGSKNKHYIVFNNKSLTELMIEKRIEKVVSGFNEAGKTGVTEKNISFYGSAQIAAWTNQYYAAIVFVKEILGQNIGSNFQLWNRWSGYAENKLKYMKDDERSSHMEFIKKELLVPRSVIRLLGISGLGKTRLALETFRPPDKDSPNNEQSILNSMVVYINCQDNQGYTIINDICQLINHNKSGIVVFDNCRPELHDRLVKEIKHKGSKLSMLSIYNDPSERSDNVIQLKQLPDQIIEQIVITAFPNLNNDQIVIRKIVELSEGFPMIASLLANSYLEREPNVGSITQKNLVERMIGCSLDLTKDECNALCSLSVFDYIGFQKKYECQLEFVADKVAEIDVSTINKFVYRFKERGIIDVRNNFLQVIPKPLAIRLAEEWWKRCSQSKAQKIFTDKNLSTDLLHSLCKQFRYLDYVPEAEEIAKNLCGNQAPFGQAEILYTERGSMVLRYFVEVNPQTTADAIYRVITKTQLPDLKLIEGRRNLVIALEMLCFWSDCFYKASRSLMWLALSESEPYANNATGQFLQLFHIYLSGADATFDERLLLIDELIGNKDKESLKLALKALKNVIYYGNFTKLTGSELQGTKQERKEWTPKKEDDIVDYIKGGLDRLLSVLNQYPETEDEVKKTFEYSLFGLIYLGIVKEVHSFIISVLSKTNKIWNRLTQSLIRLQKHDQFMNDPKRSDCITKCIDALSPKTIENQILEVICSPPYDIEKDDNGEYVDISKQRAEELVIELIQNNEINKHLKMLLKGEQRYGMMIGFQFGKLKKDKLAIFNELVKAFKEIDEKESNPSVIAGLSQYVKNTDTNLYRQIIQNMLQDAVMNRFLFDIIRMQSLDAYDLDIIEHLIESNLVNTDQFMVLAYGGVLKNCSPEHVQKLVCKAVEVSTDFVHPSIDIIALYVMFEENDVKLHGMNPFVQELIMKAPLASYVNKDSMSLYHRQELIERTLKLMVIEPNFISFIIKDALELSKDYLGSFKLHSDIRSLIFLLLEHKYEESWKSISSILLDDTQPTAHWLLSILNPKNNIGENKGLDSILSESKIVDWCKKEKRAREILPSLITVLISKNDTVQFHQLILKLLSMKLYNQSTLDSIYSNMMPRVRGGSTISIYKRHIEVLESLSQHNDPLIVNWVVTCIDDLNKKIEFEKERESEYYFRFR